MHGVEVIRQVPDYTPADRLNIRMPALTIGDERRRQQRLRLLPEFLLQPRVLERTGADSALQGLFSGRFSREILYEDSSTSERDR
jgi:hypothetical protein